jgi:hypothetical protein
MAKCGVCGGGIANTLVPHGAICEDDRVGERMTYSPEIDDLQKMEDESSMTGFEMWLKNQQQKGAYLEDAPSDGYSNEREDND